MTLSEQQQRKRSKQLSYILRHRPDSIGIELDDQGWVAVDTLLEALSQKHQSWNRPLLEGIVAHCPKQRFAFSEDNTHIRANQGHSVRVELDHPERTPPRWLYHGTVARFLKAIDAQGLRPMDRHDVHLSADTETATTVAKRRGKPVILRVDAAAMHRDGHRFRLTDNGVWLAAEVPPRYLDRNP